MILTRPKLIAQQRFDLEDWNLLLSAGRTDAKYKIKQFRSPTNYILKGFAVSGLGFKTASVDMTDATLMIPQGTSDFSWFSAEAGASAITITDAQLTDNARNYVEISLANADGTPLTRAFWDPEANEGVGVEFSQVTNTVTEVGIAITVSTGGFTGSVDKLKLCVIDTDSSGNIVTIFDWRDLFYRLSTTGNLSNSYAWGTKQEPLYTMTLTGGAGTYVAGEIITFTGAITATVVTGGTTSITFNIPSSKTFTKGNTVTGGTSGASRTVATIVESFTGVDKSISNDKNMFDALMSEIKAIKNVPFWWQDAASSITGIKRHLESFLIQNVDGAKFVWNGSVLSISDGSGSPADADVVGNIKIPGSSQLLNLTREDGTGGSSTIAIAEGQLIYVDIPATGDRTYSGSGSGSTNYKVAAIGSYIPSDTSYWIAYRELNKLYVRGYGEMQSGETAFIGDPANPQTLAFIGATSETDSAPAYSSVKYVTAGQALNVAIAALDLKLYKGAQSLATAAGTTVLTNTSNKIYTLTGTLAQTMRLPSTATIQISDEFVFLNRSTGDITVQDSASTVLGTLAPGQVGRFFVLSIGAQTWMQFIQNTDDGTTNFTIANNQVAAADITGLLIPGSRFRSFSASYWAYRTTAAPAEIAEKGTIEGVYKTTAGTWEISIFGVVGDAQIDFTITAAGQVKYTSTNLAGASYAGNLRWIVNELIRI